MDTNILQDKNKLIQAALLMILPFLLILLGLGINIQNVWYFVLAITWFGSGIVFFGLLNS